MKPANVMIPLTSYRKMEQSIILWPVFVSLVRAATAFVAFAVAVVKFYSEVQGYLA